MISHDARTSNSYRISPNKRHFEALRCDAYGRATLKNGRRLFQIKNNTHQEFQNYIIFYFLITLNNYHYDIYSYLFLDY